MRPLEALVRYRTGSRCWRVGPDVMRRWDKAAVRSAPRAQPGLGQRRRMGGGWTSGLQFPDSGVALQDPQVNLGINASFNCHNLFATPIGANYEFFAGCHVHDV